MSYVTHSVNKQLRGPAVCGRNCVRSRGFRDKRCGPAPRGLESYNRYFFFGVWLLSLNMSVRFINVVRCHYNLFFLKIARYSIVWI